MLRHNRSLHHQRSCSLPTRLPTNRQHISRTNRLCNEDEGLKAEIDRAEWRLNPINEWVVGGGALELPEDVAYDINKDRFDDFGPIIFQKFDVNDHDVDRRVR